MSNWRERADEAAQKLDDMIRLDEMSETLRDRLKRIRSLLVRKSGTNVVKFKDEARRRSK